MNEAQEDAIKALEKYIKVLTKEYDQFRAGDRVNYPDNFKEKFCMGSWLTARKLREAGESRLRLEGLKYRPIKTTNKAVVEWADHAVSSRLIPKA